MELYVYYSIVIFGTIIVSLYVYIFWVKLREHLLNRKKQRYEKLLYPLINELIENFMNDHTIDLTEQTTILNKYCRNRLKKRVVEERMIYYLEMLKDTSKRSLIQLCEKVGIIHLELKELAKKNVYSKALACKRLGELRSSLAIPHLLRELHSPSQDVVYNALLALAKIGNTSVFLEAFKNINSSILLSERSLIEIADSFEGDKDTVYTQMINSQDEFISCIFIKSAGSSKSQHLTKQIASFLKSSSKERTIAALKALSTMHNTSYKGELMALLANENWEIRAMAAKALSAYHDDDVINTLIKALSDMQWFVRENAARSLLAIDKNLKHIATVFEGTDRFAKDILIAELERIHTLSALLDEPASAASLSPHAIQLIKNYVSEGD